MKVTKAGILAVMLVVIAVALAGCTGSSPEATAAPAAGSPQSGGQAAGGAQAPAAGGASAADLFGADYNWVEYKIISNSAGEEMIIYYKFTKDGKCTMRFEGAGAEMMAGMPSEFDCSTSGTGDVQSNPNDVVAPDVQLVKVGTETVTVGAGTFVADKYSITSNGVTAYYWFAAGKPILKWESNYEGTSAIMELNGWG
jgi:hypothetical protein